MKFILQKLYIFLLLKLGIFSSLFSQELWNCNDNLLTLVGNNLGIHVSSISNTSIEIEETILDLGLGSSPIYTNAIGYRKKEDAIYGIKYENNQQILFKITVYGELTDLHVFSDDEIELPLAGCMSSDDDHLLILTTVKNVLVSIDLRDGSFTQSRVLIEELNNYALLDVATNPMNGLVYGIAIVGVEPPEYHVATIDPFSGKLLEINEFINHESVISFASIGITTNEILIAHNVGTEDILAYYHIPSKKITNIIEETLPIFEDLLDYGADGCSCLSGALKLQKFYSQDTISRCRNERLTYRVLNYDIDNTDIGFLITDTLSEDLIIKEILYSDPEYIINIETENIINISNQNGLKYGLDSIVFLVSVNENSTASSFESQAVLYNCMGNINDCSQIVTRSDDPIYPNEKNDPTLLTISDIHDESRPQIDSLIYICRDSIITLKLLSDVVAFEVEWYDGSTENSRTFDEAGVYPVIIRDNCKEYEFDVHVIESRIEVELESEYEVIFGTTVEIFSNVDSDSPLESQSWYLDTHLYDLCEEECNSVILNVVNHQVLKTQVINEAGCFAEASSRLKVSAPIYAPTAFSPNQDGNNDFYYLQSESNLLVQGLEIYNKWGGSVFSNENFFTNDETSGWDGMSRGKESAIGTYIWVAMLNINGEKIKLSGEINLIK